MVSSMVAHSYGGTQRPTFSQFSPHHTFFQNRFLKKSVVWFHTTTTPHFFPKQLFEKKCGVVSQPHHFFSKSCFEKKCAVTTTPHFFSKSSFGKKCGVTCGVTPQLLSLAMCWEPSSRQKCYFDILCLVSLSVCEHFPLLIKAKVSIVWRR